MEIGASKVKKFKRAIIHDPNSFDANLGLAMVFFKRDAFLEALPYAEKASRIDPASGDAKALLGAIYIELGKDDKAEECLAEAVRRAPEDYGVYSQLAEVRSRLNDVSGAIKVLEEAVHRYPKNADALNDLGVAYNLAGDVIGAAEQFREAVSVDPKNADALFNSAVIYLQQGEMEEAVIALGKLVELEPDNAEHHRNAGFAYRGSGKPDRAIAAFEKAVALDPDDPDSHYGLGLTLLELGRVNDAVRNLEKCRTLRPNHEDALLALMVCYARRGEVEKIAGLWQDSPAAVTRERKVPRVGRMRFSKAKEVIPPQKIEVTERAVAHLAEEPMDVSVVVPVVGGPENIGAFHSRLAPVLDRTEKRCEVVYVDSGSQDGTINVLRDINRSDDRAKIIRLVKGCASSAVLSAGLDHTHGSVIVTASEDLQDDPEDILRLLHKLDEGFDLVAGFSEAPERTSVVARAVSHVVRRAVGRLIGSELRQYGALRAFRKEISSSIGLPDRGFLAEPTVAASRGISIAQMPVQRAQNVSNRGQRGWSSGPGSVLDAVVARFVAQDGGEALRCFGKLGLGSAAIGAIGAALIAIVTLVASRNVWWSAVLVVAAFFVLAAILLATAGVVVEILIRALRQGGGTRSYVVKEVVE